MRSFEWKCALEALELAFDKIKIDFLWKTTVGFITFTARMA